MNREGRWRQIPIKKLPDKLARRKVECVGLSKEMSTKFENLDVHGNLGWKEGGEGG